jgi:hypothetical protein
MKRDKPTSLDVLLLDYEFSALLAISGPKVFAQFLLPDKVNDQRASPTLKVVQIPMSPQGLDSVQ